MLIFQSILDITFLGLHFHCLYLPHNFNIHFIVLKNDVEQESKLYLRKFKILVDRLKNTLSYRTWELWERI